MKAKQILILGPKINLIDEVRASYSSEDSLIIGDGHNLVSEEEIQKAIDDRGVEDNASICIFGHGNTNADVHCIEMLQPSFPDARPDTGYLLSKIKEIINTKEGKEVPVVSDVHSCYSGAANGRNLANGSVVTLHGPNDELCLMSAGNLSIKNSTKQDPSKILRNIILGSIFDPQGLTIGIKDKEGNYHDVVLRPPKKPLTNPDEISRYMTKIWKDKIQEAFGGISTELLPDGFKLEDFPDQETIRQTVADNLITYQQLQLNALIINKDTVKAKEFLTRIDPKALMRKDIIGYSPLIFAIEYDKSLVQPLVNGGADINLPHPSGKTPLGFAYEKNDLDSMVILLKAGSDLSCFTDEEKQNLLIRACKFNNSDLALELIKRGTNPNVADNDGNTPLHFACFRDNKDLVVDLISSGANIDAIDKAGQTPLHYACESGKTPIAHELISTGANINVADNDGRTPLHYACESGKTPIAHELISIGADINVVDKYGRTPLHNACSSGNIVLAKELISKGANINAKDKNGVTPFLSICHSDNTDLVKELISCGADVNVVDIYGRTLLHNACESGKTPIAHELISIGANINVVDKYGRTPLHNACELGKTPIAHELISIGADINVVDIYGKTPLHYACELGKTPIAHELISIGADINVVDRYGRTPLHNACSSGNIVLAMELISRGANINAKDKNGVTPFLSISGSSKTDLVKQLISCGADINAADNDGITFLHKVCDIGNIDNVKELISQGANVNVADKDGNTPLIHACLLHTRPHLASLTHTKNLVKELISHGANIHAKNRDGKTVLDLPQVAQEIKELLTHKIQEDQRIAASKITNFLKAKATSRPPALHTHGKAKSGDSTMSQGKY